MAKKDQTTIINDFVMRYGDTGFGWPVPNERLVAIVTGNRERIAGLVDPHGAITLLGLKNLYAYFLRYSQEQLTDPAYLLTPRLAEQIAKHWIAVSPPVSFEDIAPFRFWSDPGYCFHRVPWDPHDAPTPRFDAMMRRTNYPEILAAFIGGLFVPGTPRQQYLWLWGEGGDGKGSLIRLLHRIMGASLVSKATPAQHDTHWTAAIEGKRLVVFPDVNGGTYVRSGHFKMLTGDDPIEVNPKYAAPYTIKPECKFIFLSNNPPEIGPLEADRRRALICRIERPDTYEEGYEEFLWGEAPAIINKCIQAYRNVVTARGIIEACKESFEDSESALVDEFESFWHDNFEFDENVSTPTREIAWVMRCYGISHVRAHDYYRYLESRYQLARSVVRDGEKTYKILKGIKKRDTALRPIPARY